jgi:hypothetical protein
MVPEDGVMICTRIFSQPIKIVEVCARNFDSPRPCQISRQKLEWSLRGTASSSGWRPGKNNPMRTSISVHHVYSKRPKFEEISDRADVKLYSAR